MGNTIIAGQPAEITEYRGRGTTGTDDDYNINKDEFRSACINYVERQLIGRHKNGVLKDEVDYFAGAISVMMVVNEIFFDSEPNNIMDICPPMWLIGPMTGRSYIKKKNGKVTYGEWE